MTQQFLFGDADLRYKKKLFVEQGSTYVEVGAKIIEPYVPPEPSIKSKEQAIISGVSQLSGKGYASYRSKLRLLFKDKKEYSKYVMLANGTHKFYDEKGAIYTGMLESIQVTPYEGSTKYVVDVTLILVKKDKYQKRDRAKFILSNYIFIQSLCILQMGGCLFLICVIYAQIYYFWLVCIS